MTSNTYLMETPHYDEPSISNMANSGSLDVVQSPWEEKNISIEEFISSIPVMTMFPLPSYDSRVILYALLYAILFLIGVCGNVSVITLIRHVHSTIPYDNTMIYILFLCCVDLASMLPLPMTIVDQILGFWMFGTPLCKIYRILEHVGRALSTFVLASMAFDRFLRVCYPHKKTSRNIVTYSLLGLSALTLLLLSPLLFNASSEEIVLKEVLLDSPWRLARVRIFKCLDHLEDATMTIFILYMFIIGFFIPVMLITVFYALMVRRLFLRSRSIPTSQVPVNRIAVYTIAISIFFVICWSPYWIAMLYNLYQTYQPIPENPEDQHYTSRQFLYIMYGIHALPYVNSSLNWLLYGLLNSQLMRRANAKKLLFGRSSREQSRCVIVPTSDNKKAENGGIGIQNDETSSILPRTSDSLL